MIKSEYIFTDFSDEIVDKKLPMFGRMDFVPDNKNEIMKNPFLYNFKESNKDINSIEDFGLIYKKKRVYLKSIIRNDELSKKKKIRILRKYFRQNKKSFYENQNELEEKVEVNDELVSQITLDRIKLKSKIIYLIILIVNLLMLSFFNGFMTNTIGTLWSNRLALRLINCTNNYKWISIITTLSLASLICTFIYYKFYYIISRDFVRMKGTYAKYIDEIFSNTEKTFRKEFNKVKKHYFKNIKLEKVDYEEYCLDNLWSIENDYTSVNKSTDDIRLKVVKAKKYQKIHKVIKLGLFIIAVLSNLFVLGLVITLGIMSI